MCPLLYTNTIKRGIAGAIISLVAIISVLLGVLVVTGTSQITIQISEIIKYTFIFLYNDNSNLLY